MAARPSFANLLNIKTMKKTYIKPHFRPVEFDVCDIIATSGYARFNYSGEGQEGDEVE